MNMLSPAQNFEIQDKPVTDGGVSSDMMQSE